MRQHEHPASYQHYFHCNCHCNHAHKFYYYGNDFLHANFLIRDADHFLPDGGLALALSSITTCY